MWSERGAYNGNLSEILTSANRAFYLRFETDDEATRKDRAAS